MMMKMFNWSSLKLWLKSLFKEVPKLPKMTKRKRDYGEEYRSYHALPEQKKRRADRNRARRQATKSGRVHKGDGKELDHVGSHRTGRLKNVPTRVTSRHANRIRQPSRP